MVVSRPIPKEKGIKGAAGAESEAVIAAALIQAGYTVLTVGKTINSPLLTH